MRVWVDCLTEGISRSYVSIQYALTYEKRCKSKNHAVKIDVEEEY
jgi:hypothetical protein